MSTLGIFVKYPQAGWVKTRLGREIGDDLSAEMYSAFLKDILASTMGIAEQRVIAYAPATEQAADFFQKMRHIDDQLWSQPTVDLGQRMSQFIAEHSGKGPVVIIGSDSPSLRRTEIENAFTKLAGHEVVVGPAMDGGYYLIGQRTHHPEIFEGINWSEPTVLSETMTRVEQHKLKWHHLSTWYDVDTRADLVRLMGDLKERSPTESDFPCETYRWLCKYPDLLSEANT